MSKLLKSMAVTLAASALGFALMYGAEIVMRGAPYTALTGDSLTIWAMILGSVMCVGMGVVVSVIGVFLKKIQEVSTVGLCIAIGVPGGALMILVLTSFLEHLLSGT